MNFRRSVGSGEREEVMCEGWISSQEERSRLEECRRNWMMKEEFEEINTSKKLSYNLKNLNVIHT